MASLLPAVGDETGGRASALAANLRAIGANRFLGGVPAAAPMLASQSQPSLRRCGSGPDVRLNYDMYGGASNSSSRPYSPSEPESPGVDARDLMREAADASGRCAQLYAAASALMGGSAAAAQPSAPYKSECRNPYNPAREVRSRPPRGAAAAAAEQQLAELEAAQFDAARIQAAALSAEQQLALSAPPPVPILGAIGSDGRCAPSGPPPAMPTLPRPQGRRAAAPAGAVPPPRSATRTRPPDGAPPPPPRRYPRLPAGSPPAVASPAEPASPGSSDAALRRVRSVGGRLQGAGRAPAVRFNVRAAPPPGLPPVADGSPLPPRIALSGVLESDAKDGASSERDLRI